MNHEQDNRDIINPLRDFERAFLSEREKLVSACKDVREEEPVIDQANEVAGHVAVSTFVDRVSNAIESLQESVGSWNIELVSEPTSDFEKLQEHLIRLRNDSRHVERELTEVIQSSARLAEQGHAEPWLEVKEIFESARDNFNSAEETAFQKLEAAMMNLFSHDSKDDAIGHDSGESSRTMFTRWLKGFFQHPDVASPHPNSGTGG
ncbi:MAG: hypothetical protein P1U86_20985 [Verrucomicrobiales bacterium]|nr:hypothetical protein [Verrucomicrobiales bacterium]